MRALTLLAAAASWGTACEQGGSGPRIVDPIASSITLSSVGTVVADGVASAAVEVRLVDLSGRPLVGREVVLLASGESNAIVQPGPTDGAGSALGALSSTTAEWKTLTVTVGADATLLAGAVTVQFVGDAENLSASASSVVVEEVAPIVADGVSTATVSVVVRDRFGNGVGDQDVVLTASGAGNVVLQPPGPTDAGGRASGSVASLVAGTKTVEATVGGGLALVQRPTAVFVGDAGAISASLSSVVVDSAGPVVADGSATAGIDVVVRDVNGNVVGGRSVQVSATGSGNTLLQDGLADSSGAAEASLATLVAETKTIRATVDPGPGQVLVDDAPTVEFVGDAANLSALLSEVSASPATSVVADGTTASTIEVVARDGNGNTVAGVEIAVAASGTGNVLGAAAPTDAGGRTTVELSTTVAETKTVSALLDPSGGMVAPVDEPMVEFIGDATTLSASTSSVTATPSFGTAADGLSAVDVVVVARDANGNPLEGIEVALQATGDGNVLVDPVAPTAADGSATGTLSSSAAESKELTATLDPTGLAVVADDSPTVAFVWDAPGGRYVRTGGSDASSGDSPATAWRTLSHAAASAAPGDTVHVGAGTYVESVLLAVGGTSGSPIVYRADRDGSYTGDGGEVIVDGGGGPWTLLLDGASHVRVEGFTILGAAAGAGVRLDPGSDDVLLRDNAIHGNGIGIDVSASDRVTVERNRLSGNSDDAVRIDDGVDAVLLGNLFWANDGAGVRVGGVGTADVRGNTIHGNEGASFGVAASGSASVVSSHNDVWGNAGGDWSGVATGAGDFSADPVFVDPDGADDLLGGAEGADDDFRLDAGAPSPALDAGSDDAGAILWSDGTSFADRSARSDDVLDGTAPDGATVDLGWHAAVAVPDLEALVAGDARVAYAQGDLRSAALRRFDGAAAVDSAWGAERAGPPCGAPIRSVVVRGSPLANDEELLAVLADDGVVAELDVHLWDGSAWRLEVTTRGIPTASAAERGFALDLEATSGEALLVWSDGGSTPLFRTRSAGEWGPESELPLNDGGGADPDPNSGAVRWLELYPRAGSDEIALVYSDDANDLVVLLWDGDAWDTASVATLETGLATVGSVVENRAFDAAFESLSGDLVVAWARQSTAGFWWAERQAAVWSAAAHAAGTPSATPTLADLAAEEGTNRIAGAFLDLAGGVERLGVATWDGDAWLDAGEIDSTIHDVDDAGEGDLPGAVGWIGTSGTAVCVYADASSGVLDWASWTEADGWSVQADVAVAGKGATESVRMESVPGEERLLLVLSDDASAFYSLVYDGGWQLAAAGLPLTTGLAGVESVPFDLSFRLP